MTIQSWSKPFDTASTLGPGDERNSAVVPESEAVGGGLETLEVLRVRQQLLERLSRIQRSILHGAPLEEVFAAIAAGAAELLGDPVSGLRLVDEHDPAAMR